MSELFLVTPPFTQLNTPYPATAYIKGFLNTKDISSFQMDLGIEVILALFSKQGLTNLFASVNEEKLKQDLNSQRIFALRKEYIKTIDEVVLFLQGKNANMARLICTPGFLPEASRFNNLQELDWAFGEMGMQDKAKHLATLYLSDISDFIVACVDENFGFSRYAERIGRSANSFDELYQKLQSELSYIDEMSLELFAQGIEREKPKLVCISVPFPGNLFSAFRCAQYLKKHHPNIKVAMGGGFPNTELRSVNDVRVFEFFDFITLDDGELPLEQLYQYVNGKANKQDLKRTFLLEDSSVVYHNNCPLADYKQHLVGTPDYTDLPLDQYISVIEIANPMHSLWSDGRWNKLTMAHGCYWGKCSFCDVSLDYIKIYEPLTAKLLVDRMEELIASTGERGFHFVDEAAPPALMRELALEILRRNLTVTWWTNIRFEKSFSQDLAYLLKASGCIAVSGGLEVASDRLLKLIDKGVTVEQVAKVCKHLTEAGIMVHSYLMYGYPTQTVQETIDSLEMVRQLFEAGVLQSGFWHQFALTAHSPIGITPEAYGIVPKIKEIGFANNDIDFEDKTGIDHNQFSFGLKKSLYNYMHGMCFDLPLQDWFETKIPKTKISADFIANTLENEALPKFKSSAKVYWLGAEPELHIRIKKKKGQEFENAHLTIHSRDNQLELKLPKGEGEWLSKTLMSLDLTNPKATTLSEIQADYENQFPDFELFWNSKALQQLKQEGLLVL